MPHSPTHVVSQPSPSPSPGPSPSGGTQIGGTTTDVPIVFDQQQQGPDFWGMAEGFLSRFLEGQHSLGLHPDPVLRRTFGRIRELTRFVPGEFRTQTRSRRESIVLLQNRLIQSGILDPEKLTHLGVLDEATLTAVRDLERYKHFYDFETEEQALREFERGFIGWGSEKRESFVPEPFTVPTFRPADDTEVKNDITSAVRDAFGRNPTDEELNRIASAFRDYERSVFQQGVESARHQHQRLQQVSRAAHEGRIDDIPSTIPGGESPTLPDPGQFATQQVLSTEDAKVWSGARLGLVLIDALKRGF